MSLRLLELSEMAGITRSWTLTHRAAFEGIAQLSPWLPALDAVHTLVIKAQPVSATELRNKVSALSNEQLAIDSRHDNTVRLVDSALDTERLRALVASPPEIERAAECGRARQALFPEGLSFINSLYVAEVGHGERTRALVDATPWLRDLLASIPLGGGKSALWAVDCWCEFAAKLGELDDQRAPLQAALSPTAGPSRAQMTVARMEWQKLVGTLLSNFELIQGHDATLAQLRLVVDRVVDNASKRGGAGTSRLSDDEPLAPCGAKPPAPVATAAVPAAEIPVGMPGSRPYI